MRTTQSHNSNVNSMMVPKKGKGREGFEAADYITILSKKNFYSFYLITPLRQKKIKQLTWSSKLGVRSDGLIIHHP